MKTMNKKKITMYIVIGVIVATLFVLPLIPSVRSQNVTGITEQCPNIPANATNIRLLKVIDITPKENASDNVVPNYEYSYTINHSYVEMLPSILKGAGLIFVTCTVCFGTCNLLFRFGKRRGVL